MKWLTVWWQLMLNASVAIVVVGVGVGDGGESRTLNVDRWVTVTWQTLNCKHHRNTWLMGDKYMQSWTCEFKFHNFRHANTYGFVDLVVNNNIAISIL